MKVHYIASKETVYNGRRYRQGDPWLPTDGGDPPGSEDGFIIRRQDDAPVAGLRSVGAATSASMGSIGWKPQPARPRAQPLSPEEKAVCRENPYVNLDEPVVAESPPPADPLLDRKKKQSAPVISAHLQMSEEEIDDPFGLKARSAARTAELQEGQEEK